MNILGEIDVLESNYDIEQTIEKNFLVFSINNTIKEMCMNKTLKMGQWAETNKRIEAQNCKTWQLYNNTLSLIQYLKLEHI